MLPICIMSMHGYVRFKVETCNVRFYVGWRREQSILYKDIETSPNKRVLKTLRGRPELGRRTKHILRCGNLS